MAGASAHEPMFDEDGDEEKEHRRGPRVQQQQQQQQQRQFQRYPQQQQQQKRAMMMAPVGGALTTVIGENGKTLAHTLEQHFQAQLSPQSGEFRAILAAITGTSFADWAYCNMSRRATAHAQIVEREPLMAPEQYSTECGRCPVNGQCAVAPVWTGQRAPPRTPEEAAAVRAAWVAAKERLAAEVVLLGARRTTHADPASLTLPMAATQGERDAWIGYMMAAFDVVRAHVVSRYLAVHNGGGAKPTPNLPRYERYLRDAADDIVARNGTHVNRSRFQAGAAVSTARLFCFRHNRVGHMFPLLGFNAYDIGCFICPLEVNRPPPVEDTSRNRVVDAAELRSLCGDPSQARINPKNQQFVDEASAAAAPRGR